MTQSIQRCPKFKRVAAVLLVILTSWTSQSAARAPDERQGDRSVTLKARLDRPGSAQPAPTPAPQQVAGEEPPSGASSEPSMPTERRVWYGWQNLAVDGAGQTLGVTLLLAMAQADGGAIGLVTVMGTYALGSPIVHFSHGNVGKGLGSFGLRVALPPAGMLTGAAIESSTCAGEPYCGLAGAGLGLIAGTVSAIVLDASLLAYEKVPRETTARYASGFESLVVTPNFSDKSAVLFLHGAF